MLVVAALMSNRGGNFTFTGLLIKVSLLLSCWTLIVLLFTIKDEDSHIFCFDSSRSTKKRKTAKSRSSDPTSLLK